MKRTRIVLPGAPGAGKSTALGNFAERLTPRPICIPEAARYVKHEARLLPPRDHKGARVYEGGMSRIRLATEDMAAVQESEASRIFFDRGIPDGACYLPGGLMELCELLEMTWEQMFDRYDLVLMFALPRRDIYDRFRANNPSRHETYEEARELDARSRRIWSGHPRLHVIEDGPSWESRFERALDIVQRAAA